MQTFRYFTTLFLFIFFVFQGLPSRGTCSPTNEMTNQNETTASTFQLMCAEIADSQTKILDRLKNMGKNQEKDRVNLERSLENVVEEKIKSLENVVEEKIKQALKNNNNENLEKLQKELQKRILELEKENKQLNEVLNQKGMKYRNINKIKRLEKIINTLRDKIKELELENERLRQSTEYKPTSD